MKSLNLSLVILAAFCLCIPAFAKDHASEYQVGTFLGTARADDGTYSYAQCGGGGCSGTGYRASHNQHQVETADGVYTLDAPISVGGTILFGMLTPGGVSPTLHKGWFMDDLHEGQRVLFYPECNKRHRCRFWLPNPDKVGKEIFTTGWFEPAVARTNTATLCGSGKLTPAVAAQVCGQNAPAPYVAPTAAAPVISSSEKDSAEPTLIGVSTSTDSTAHPQHPAVALGANEASQMSVPMFLNPDSPEVEPLVNAGEASRGAVLTVPPAADVYIDGQKVGVSPAAIVLVRNGNIPRVIRIVKNGFVPIEKKVIPDGTTIRIEVFLQTSDSQ